jgi:Mn2+/Fe2+ NRAMP family transporter
VIEKMMLWLVVVFLTYVVAGILSHPAWGVVLKSTVLPPIKPSLAYFTSTVGLLGTTITPYLFFWQTAAEREERRGVEQLKNTYIDVASGMIFSNVIAYFIIVSAASTLYSHHRTISTARDAAAALQPVAGPFATVLFSVGILGAGLLSIPVLAISTGYVIAGTFGWRMGLGRESFRAPGFYAVIVLALLAGVELAISGFSPIKAMFYSQVLDGLVAPVLLFCMMILVSRRALMGEFIAGIWEKIGGWAAVVVILLADCAFVYSLIASH